MNKRIFIAVFTLGIAVLLTLLFIENNNKNNININIGGRRVQFYNGNYYVENSYYNISTVDGSTFNEIIVSEDKIWSFLIADEKIYTYGVGTSDTMKFSQYDMNGSLISEKSLRTYEQMFILSKINSGLLCVTNNGKYYIYDSDNNFEETEMLLDDTISINEKQFTTIGNKLIIIEVDRVKALFEDDETIYEWGGFKYLRFGSIVYEIASRDDEAYIIRYDLSFGTSERLDCYPNGIDSEIELCCLKNNILYSSGMNAEYNSQFGEVSSEFGRSINLKDHIHDFIITIDVDVPEIIHNYQTHKHERILWISSDKFITLYKNEYLTYSLDNYKVVDKQLADEIKSGGTYAFESCDDYVFVFDVSSGKMINKIPIDPNK